MLEEKHIVLQGSDHNQRTGRWGDWGKWLPCAFLLETVVTGRAHGPCPFCHGDQEGGVTGDTLCFLTGLLGVTVSLGGCTHVLIFPPFLRDFSFTLVEGFFFQLIYDFDP